MPKAKSIVSIGHMAMALQRPVEEVRRLAAEVGAHPCMTIDLVEYFDGPVLGTLLARQAGWTDQPAYSRTFYDEAQEA